MAARVFCPVFESGKRRMEEIGADDFENEKAMQDIVGDNLGVIFPDLEIVEHEISLKSKRFDTVAFNVRTRSFVLIEYKKVQKDSTLVQILSYLRTLRGNEGNFLQACKEKSGKKYEKEDVDWGKTRVVWVAPSFTDSQLEAVEQSKELIELHRITKYGNQIIAVEMMTGPKAEKIVEKNTNHDKADEVEVIYRDLEKILRVDLHLEKTEGRVYENWFSNKNGQAVCTVAKQTKTLVLCYITKSLNVDKEDKVFVRHMVKNAKKIGKRGRGDYMTTIRSVEDVKRAIRYLEQVCTQKTKNIVNQRQGKHENLPRQDDTKYVMQKGSNQTIAPYTELKNTLCNSIPYLKFIVTKRYINCKSSVTGKIICSVVVNKKALKLSYNTRRLDVPESDDSFVRHLFNNGKWISIAPPGDYDSKLGTREDVERAIPYIKKVHLQEVAI